jgi:hypothetical protein
MARAWWQQAAKARGWRQLAAKARAWRQQAANFQRVQDRNMTAAIQSGFTQRLNPPLLQNLASIMAQQQQAASALPKDEDEA